MGFCTDEQNKRFLKDVPMFEEMLVKDGIKLFKFYFSVSKQIQNERFESRKTDRSKAISNSRLLTILHRSFGINTPFANFRCSLKPIEQFPLDDYPIKR